MTCPASQFWLLVGIGPKQLLSHQAVLLIWPGQLLDDPCNRVLKCDVIKMKFLKLWDVSGYSERTMSKRPSCQKWAFRGKLSPRSSPVMLRKCHTNPSNVFGGRPKKKLEGFVWSFLSITGLRSQRQFTPKCSCLATRPLGHCSFRISWQIP